MRLLSPKSALILSAFLNRPGVPQYGYELMQETGIKSGSLYPILGRFEQLGWIAGRTEPSTGGRPPRRLYEFRPDAVADARAALDRYLDTAEVATADRLGWGLA